MVVRVARFAGVVIGGSGRAMWLLLRSPQGLLTCVGEIELVEDATDLEHPMHVRRCSVLEPEALAVPAGEAVRDEQVVDERGVDEGRFRDVDDDELVLDQQPVQQISDFVLRGEIVLALAFHDSDPFGHDQHLYLAYINFGHVGPRNRNSQSQSQSRSLSTTPGQGARSEHPIGVERSGGPTPTGSGSRTSSTDNTQLGEIYARAAKRWSRSLVG